MQLHYLLVIVVMHDVSDSDALIFAVNYLLGYVRK